MTFSDPQLALILDKLQSGRPLDRDDALILYRSHDLLGIGQLANSVREKRHGHAAWTRLDLQSPPMLAASQSERIAALLAIGEAAEYEPPLQAALSGHMYLKHVAVARLLLDRVDHIVVRHCPQVENVCQVALRFGADTLAGADVAELQRQASAAGFVTTDEHSAAERQPN